MVHGTEGQRDRHASTPQTGTIREFPIPTKNAQPDGIAVGPDGRVWFAEVGAGKVGILTP